MKFGHFFLSNCDIDFLNFCHCQVWNFKISNLCKWNHNFGVIFWKYQVRNWKSTKYFETSWKLSVIPLEFHEMSLVLWNLINYCKILQCLVKFCRSPKDLRKILIKWLGKTVKYCLNFVNFHSCTEKWLKFSQLSSLTLTKVYGIPQGFLGHKLLVLTKFHLIFVSFMTEMFCFTKILQLPIFFCKVCQKF